jgi:phosphatidylinositol alpha-1,6-mannosyltransferase
MGTGEPAPELGDRAVSHAVYQASGSFSPALKQNLQAAFFLLMKSRADLWHFVFAPNPRSSQVGGVLKKLRGTPTLQTIASPPRTFDNPGKLLFGDIAVAQSTWTRTQFEASLERAGVERRIEVVPPPAPVLPRPDEARCAQERARLGLSADTPLFVYPGDLEVSEGADHVVEWAKEIGARVPGARILVAYRDKTAGAEERASALAEVADETLVSFECNVPDIHALIATATAVLFPVDDLYGKVDLPIVLLEALRFGTPVLALNEGPLRDLKGAVLLSEKTADWLSAIEQVGTDAGFRDQCAQRGKSEVEEHFAPATIARRYEALYQELL